MLLLARISHPMLSSHNKSTNAAIDGGWKIKIAEESYSDTIEQICISIDDLEKKDSAISLKSASDKKVFLITEKAEPLLIKNHIHQSLGSRLKASLRYYRGKEKQTTYLLREYENTRRANGLTVPSSRMLGYGCRVSKGLVCKELLISSGSPDTQPLIDRLRIHKDNEEEIRNNLQRAFNPILRMLKAGYVHLDMHSDNILISASGVDNDIIIDHEFASLFPQNKLVEVAAFVFGYLYRCQVREHIAFERYAALVQQAVSSLVEEQQQLRSSFDSRFRFAAYTRVPKKKRSRYLGL